MALDYGAAVMGIGAAIPARSVDNAELEQRMDTTDAWIRSHIGIRARRVVEPDQAMSDLAIPAAREALANAGVGADEVDLIVVAGSNHDYLMPATACLVQDALGARAAGALDIKNACSGFVYALGAAAGLVQNGTCRTILVIGAEIHSKIIDWNDRTMAPFFGDGAGAVVLRRSRPGVGVLSAVYGADGSNADAIIVEAGGSREPTTAEALARGATLCRQDGARVKRFIQRVFPESVRAVTARVGLTPEDLDFVISHQSNLRLIEEGLDELGVDRQKTHTIIEDYGNQGSASIPIVWRDALRLGKIGPGSLVALSGYGAGLAYGAVLVRLAGRDDFLEADR
jgi:3-oxoacyl-[acyl-carrier-protein] synthase-3